MNREDLELINDIVWEKINRRRQSNHSDHSDESNRLFELKRTIEKEMVKR